MRRHKTAKDFRALLEGHTIKSVAAPRQEPRLRAGQRHAPRRPPRHERPAAAREGRRRTPSPSTPTSCSPSSRATSCATSTRGPSASSTSRCPPPEGEEVEISKFARLSIGGDGLALRQARCPNWRTSGIDPFEDQIGWDRFAAILRSRSTWRSRPSSPTRTSSRASATSTPTRSSSPPGCGSTASPSHSRRSRSDACTARSPRSLTEAIKHGGIDARRRAVRRSRRRARHVPAVPPGLQPRGSGVLPVPPTHRARNACAGARTFFCAEVPERSARVTPEKVASVYPCFLSD